jgi:hypothetical protein
MHTPSRVSIYGALGLACFGAGYDCGLFGSPDGHDHSAVISIPASTGTVTMSAGVIYFTQAVTGQDVAVPLPVTLKRVTQV